MFISQLCFFWELSVKSVAHLLMGLFGFLVFSFWALSIFWILIPCVMTAGKGFLSFYILSLHSSNCFLCCAEIWYNPICHSLLLFPEQFSSYSESHCPGLYLQVFTSCFPTAVSDFRSYIKVFDPFWIDFVQSEEIGSASVFADSRPGPS
jgi:hypothetical protein